MSPVISARTSALEYEKRRKDLENRLGSNRPSQEDLRQHNILKGIGACLWVLVTCAGENHVAASLAEVQQKIKW